MLRYLYKGKNNLKIFQRSLIWPLLEAGIINLCHILIAISQNVRINHFISFLALSQNFWLPCTNNVVKSDINCEYEKQLINRPINSKLSRKKIVKKSFHKGYYRCMDELCYQLCKALYNNFSSCQAYMYTTKISIIFAIKTNEICAFLFARSRSIFMALNNVGKF